MAENCEIRVPNVVKYHAPFALFRHPNKPFDVQLHKSDSARACTQTHEALPTFQTGQNGILRVKIERRANTSTAFDENFPGGT
jgi:hypothetical protein